MVKFASYFLLAMAVLLGVGVAASWAPDRSVEQLSERWATPPSTFVEVDGMQVHIRDQGPHNDATPLVLIHGTSASLHTWDDWTTDLSADRRVVRFDLPAFGLTGPAPDNDYTIERYADFVVKMLNLSGIEQAVLAGNSLGGQIAMETALHAPERVAGLVLVDAAGYPFKAESMPLGFRLAQIPAFAPLMNRILPRSIIASSVRNVYSNPSLVSEELIDRYYELTLRAGNRQALPQRFKQMHFHDDTRQRARTLTMPTLIIWGEDDHLLPPTLGAQMHEDIAASELVMIAAAGHVPHEEAPQETLLLVHKFLADHEL